MNEDTRVSIHCYAGDAHQLYMPAYLHHGCPITIMSPDDSRVFVNDVYHDHGDHNVDAQFVGKRAYIGQDSLDRQLAQMKLLLTYPENHFLMHDSDSVMLDAKIPDYLYRDPHSVWSNLVEDGIPDHQRVFEPGWPHIALQPPYFLSRKTLEAMVAVGDDPRVAASSVMPFIDYYLLQLTMVAGLEPRRFMDCLSCPITCDPQQKAGCNPGQVETYFKGHSTAKNAVLYRGVNVLHSVKDPEVVREFMQDRAVFLGENPKAQPRVSPAPRVGGGPRRTRQYPTDSGRA